MYDKYRLLYNSVPTRDEELRSSRDTVNDVILATHHGTIVTPTIIKHCISKLNYGKDDGDYGFKSVHIINDSHRLLVLLTMLFNLMVVHGHIPTDLLKSTIVSIPKDNKASLSSVDNYRVYLCSIQCVYYLTMLFCLCLK